MAASADGLVDLDIWPCNQVAVEVFERCLGSLEGIGMSGLIYTGIAATEVLAACRLVRVPVRDWPEVSDDVTYMGRVVANRLNKLAARKPENRQ